MGEILRQIHELKFTRSELPHVPLGGTLLEKHMVMFADQEAKFLKVLAS